MCGILMYDYRNWLPMIIAYDYEFYNYYRYSIIVILFKTTTILHFKHPIIWYDIIIERNAHLIEQYDRKNLTSYYFNMLI